MMLFQAIIAIQILFIIAYGQNSANNGMTIADSDNTNNSDNNNSPDSKLNATSVLNTYVDTIQGVVNDYLHEGKTFDKLGAPTFPNGVVSGVAPMVSQILASTADFLFRGLFNVPSNLSGAFA